MNTFKFARWSAVGFAVVMSTAGFAQAALLSFPDASGAPSSFLALPECKLTAAIETMPFTSGLFLYKTYRPGRPVFGNINFKMPPSSTQFDVLIDSLLHSVVVPQQMQVTMLDDPLSRACTRYTFNECFITSFTTPSCNREASTPSVSEIVVTKRQDYSYVQTKWPKSSLISKQKAWLCSNFRVSIPGLDEACAGALHVKPMCISQGDEDSDGDGILDFTVTDFVMDVPADAAMSKGMYDWIHARDSRPCTIDYLAADGSITRTFTLTSLMPVEVTQRSTSTMTLRCVVAGPMSWT